MKIHPLRIKCEVTTPGKPSPPCFFKTEVKTSRKPYPLFSETALTAFMETHPLLIKCAVTTY